MQLPVLQNQTNPTGLTLSFQPPSGGFFFW